MRAKGGRAHRRVVGAAPLEQAVDRGRAADDAQDVDRHGGVGRLLSRVGQQHRHRSTVPAPGSLRRPARADAAIRRAAAPAAPGRTADRRCARARRRPPPALPRAPRRARRAARRRSTVRERAPAPAPPRREPTSGDRRATVVQRSIRPSAAAASRSRGTTSPVVSRSAASSRSARIVAMPSRRRRPGAARVRLRRGRQERVDERPIAGDDPLPAEEAQLVDGAPDDQAEQRERAAATGQPGDESARATAATERRVRFASLA